MVHRKMKRAKHFSRIAVISFLLLSLAALFLLDRASAQSQQSLKCVQVGGSPLDNNTAQIFVRNGYPAYVNVSNALFIGGFSGNVGIGTASPGAKLDIQGGNLNVGSASIKGDGSVSTGLNAERVGGYTAADLLAAGGGCVTPISPVDSKIVVPGGGGHVDVDIRPPAGQTWHIKLAVGMVGPGGWGLSAYKYDGSSQTGGLIGTSIGGSAGVYGEFEITNLNWLRLSFYGSVQGGTGFWSYFGTQC